MSSDKKETKSLENLPPYPEKFSALPARGLTAATAKVYGIENLDYKKDKREHLYPYHNDKGEYIAAKVRYQEKQFSVKGSFKDAVLFGQDKFPSGCAKQITLVEGELDAAAAFQMQGSMFPVLSVKSASSAKKDCIKSLKYLNTFDTIVVCFDMDEAKVQPNGDKRYPGQEAAQEVARLFAPNKVRIVSLAKYKDPNEYLMKGEEKAFMKEWWNAPTFTPAGLKLGKDLWGAVSTPKDYKSISYPWDGINEKTYGIRLSEFVVITATTGAGKTTVCKEIEHHILQESPDAGVGILHLEEPNDDTALGLMSITANLPLHLPDVRKSVSQEDLKSYFDDTLNNDRVIMWDHFGSNGIDEVLSTIRYMHAMGCDYIFLDHISFLASDHSDDERKKLDRASTALKTLCMELNIALICVVHQNRSGEIHGSSNIEKVANIVIKLHRDKKEKDDYRRNVTTLEIEKNRFCGRTGPGTHLHYDNSTGRLNQMTREEIERFEEGMRPEEFPVEDWST